MNAASVHLFGAALDASDFARVTGNPEGILELAPVGRSPAPLWSARMDKTKAEASCARLESQGRLSLRYVRCLTLSSSMKTRTPSMALAMPDNNSCGQVHAMRNPTRPREIMK